MTGEREPEPRSYELRVRGHLGETMRSAFPTLAAETRGSDTILRGALRDQAALFGVLAEIEALGLELLEVRQLPPDGGHPLESPRAGDDNSPRQV